MTTPVDTRGWPGTFHFGLFEFDEGRPQMDCHISQGDVAYFEHKHWMAVKALTRRGVVMCPGDLLDGPKHTEEGRPQMDLVQAGAKIDGLRDEVSILKGTLDRMHRGLAKREPLVAVLLDKLSEARELLTTAEVICGNIAGRHPGV